MSDPYLQYELLLDEALNAAKMRDFAAALSPAENAVDIARREFGTSSVEFRDAVHCLAVVCVERRNVVVGRALLEWLAQAWPDTNWPLVRAEIACCMIKENEREQGLLILNTLLQALQDSHPVMLVEALNAIGNTSMDSGHPEDALIPYQVVEKLRRKLNDRYKIAEGLYNLGSCYVALADYSNALAPLTEALEIFRSIFADSHQLIAETAIRLGWSFHRLGEFQKATAAYRLALRSLKLNDPEVDPSGFAEQLRLAEMELPLGTIPPPQLPERTSPFVALTKGLDSVAVRRFDEVVRRFYSRDYFGCAEVALNSMPSLARYDVIQMLLCSLERLGRADLVAAVGRWAISVSAGSQYQNLIKFLVGQQSETEMRRLVAGYIPEAVLDFAVACKLSNDGKGADAKALMQRIIDDEPNSLEGLSALVENYLRDVTPKPLSGTEQTALRELVLQRERGQELNQQRSLVQTLTDKGNFDEAIAEQQKLLRKSKETAEKNPIPYALDLNNLAHILFECGRYEESLPFYELCVETLRAVPDSSQAGDAANNLGNTYFELHRFADAVEYHELATKLRMKAYGNHPRVILGLLDLAKAYREFDRSALNDVYQRALQCVVDGLGKKFPQLIFRVKSTVSQALSRADFDTAHESIRDLMATWEAILDATLNPRSTLAAGVAHQLEGRTEAAVVFIRLAADRAVQSGSLDIEIAAMIELGKIAFNAGNPEDAFRLATQASLKLRQLKEDFGALWGRVLLLLGRCLVEQGDQLEKALEVLTEVVTPGRATETATRMVAHTLIAQIKFMRGSRQQAIESLEAAKHETETLPTHDALIALWSIASQLRLCNAGDRVSDCLERAQAMISAGGEIADTQRAVFLSLQCSQAVALGDYQRAYGLCREALQFCGNAGESDPSLRAELFEDFGEIAILSQRNFNRASEAYKLAIGEYEKCSGEFRFAKARVRVSLAKSLLAAGELAPASNAILEAVNELQALVGNDHWLFADALGTAGKINLRIGARQTAESQLYEAKQIFTRLLDADHVMVVHLNMELSFLHLEEERWSEALHEARLSRLALETLYTPPNQAFLFCQKIEARANYALGNVDLALQSMISVLSDEALLYLQVAQATNNAERMRMANSINDVLDEILTMAWKSDRLNEPELVGPLFLATVRSKRLATEMFSKQEAALRKISDTTLQKKLAELRELRSLHAQTALADPMNPLTDKERENLGRIQTSIERLEFELSMAVPQLISSQDLHRVTIENIAAQLSEEQAIVIYVKFNVVSPTGPKIDIFELSDNSQYLAFVLTTQPQGKQAIVRVISLGARKEIDDLVDEYRSSLTDGKETDVASAKLVFERLVRPLLLEGTKAIYIVPDGSLYSLPFEAVPIDGNTLLADLFDVTYLEAVRDLLRTHDKAELPSQPVVIAGPDYGLAATSGEQAELSDNDASPFFSPLPGAEEEGRLVAELLGTEVITGSAATETRLKSVSSPRVLHLATHGYYFPVRRQTERVYDWVEMVRIPGEGTYPVRVSPKHVENDDLPFHQSRIENPMLRSGMALAGANTWINRSGSKLEAEDGLLSSADITGLDLRNTEIVVLSACETGLGVIDDAEGVIGVRRAFVIAGTKSLVCSLWEVPDEETKRLMVSFYSFVKNGSRPADALKLAKAELRDDGLPPLCWAGFIHIGRF